jgi:hypothetical protein
MPLRVVMEYKRPTPKTVALDQRWMVIAWPIAPNSKVNIAETAPRPEVLRRRLSEAVARDSSRSL